MLIDNKDLTSLAKRFNKSGFKAYAVGGCVRDALMGIDGNGDLDIATDATPDEMRTFCEVVGSIGAGFGTLIVKEGNTKFECTTFRKDVGERDGRHPVSVEFSKELYDDAIRRDFTMNSVYFNPVDGTVIDPNGGIQDVKDKKIRFVGDAGKRLNEDSLRVLRFVRFKNRFGFHADQYEFKELSNHVVMAASLPVERLTEEFLKTISHESRSSALQDLSSIGFLSAVVPELESLKSVPGGSPYHLEGDVWTHTLMVASEIDSSIEEIEKKRGNPFNKSESLAIKLAAVFHDIGKGKTVTHAESGDVHYYGHESESAIKFDAFCVRMKIAKDVSSLASWLIANHLVPFKLLGMRKPKAGEAMYDKRFPALLALSIADALGRFPRQEDFAGKIYRFYSEFLENLKGVKLTTGDDLKRKNPELEGVKFGESLRSIRISELSKLVPTKDN